MSLRCSLGIHKGTWIYRYSNDCEQIHKCERCYKVRSRVQHQGWTKWLYIRQGDCAMTKSCIRCDEEKNQVSHSWDNPYYKYSNSCETSKTCVRCNIEIDNGKIHNYSHERYYYSSGNCWTYSPCKRCNDRKIMPEEHQWVLLNSSGARICRRCKKRD